MLNLDPVLVSLEQYAALNRVPIIQPEAAKVLISALKGQAPSAVLEIGTAIGYSTLLIASHLSAHSHITTIELDENRAQVARNYIEQAGFRDKVTLLTGDAGKLISNLEGPFDFVFLDAAKGQYPDYLAKVTEKLSDKACIVADNVLFRGLVLEPSETPRRFRTIVKRLQTYLYTVSNVPCFDTILYKIGDGMAVTQYMKEK